MSLLEKSASVELSRRTQPFYAKKQAYKLGNQVQIEIDTQREYIDPESLRIVFDLHDTGTTAVGKVTNPWTASACIKNLRVKTLSGQMIGHEIREYRGAYRFFKKMGTSNSEARASTEDYEEGALGLDNLGGNITAGSRQYAHKPMAHVLSVKEYYPAHFHQGLMLEFDVSDNAFEILRYTTAPAKNDIQLQDVRVVVDLVQLKPEIENEMVRLMEEQKLFVDYTEWLTQENSLGTPAESYDIVGIDGRVKSAFQFGISNITAGSTDNRLNGVGDFWGTDTGLQVEDSQMSRNGLSSYRFRLGSRYLNYAPIVVGDDQRAEYSYELAKALDIHCDKQRGDVLRSYAKQDTNFFGIGVKVDKAQCDVDEVISSQVDKDRNNMRIELSSQTAASAGYSIVVLDKRLQLLPGSIVRNVRS